MYDKKLIITILMLFLVFQTIGSAFAGANINVVFDRDTANVGDQINLIVTITNTGPEDLSGVFVYAPLPSGLKFVMSATGTTKNLYNPDTGVWEVDNLKLTSQGGGVKTLTVTSEVTPELAGETITTKASYISVFKGDPPISLPLTSSMSGILKINDPNANTGNNTGNDTENNTESNGNNNNNGKNTNLNSLLDSVGDLNDVSIQDIGKSEQNGQKGYEIYNNTGSNNNGTDMQSTILGLLIIAGVIIFGYLIGSRSK